jgi:hypothetical protein
MSKQPLPQVLPGQGQWHIPRNAVDRGFDNYLSISGGGGDTHTDSPVLIQTKSDVRFEATKELLVTVSNLERAAKVLEDYARLFININIGTSRNEIIAKSRQLNNIIWPLLSSASKSHNDISNSFAPIPSVKYLHDRIERKRVREVVDESNVECRQNCSWFPIIYCKR